MRIHARPGCLKTALASPTIEHSLIGERYVVRVACFDCHEANHLACLIEVFD